MYENFETADFQSSVSSTNNHMKKVFLWMFSALVVTALVSLFASTNEGMLAFINSPGVFILLIAEILLVIFLAGRIKKMKQTTATLLFLLYAVINGIVFAGIFEKYTSESIVNTFFITAGMFGALAVFGYTTKKDLSTWGTFLFMALIGLLLASLVNIFVGGTALGFVISILGVFVFAGLTAYDMQMIKNEAWYRKYPIMGALELYLDFINLFLQLLRFFGVGKD